ncbi:M15 family metallopeptidase [Gemmatimonas sp.]|uniref:M15 family metallopeptidase n=1 Tax=Gemmatimonas sp. TaxID=1962908 RepID=UPI00398348E7
MNVTTAVTTTAPRLERATERALERTTRSDTDHTETESTAESEKKRGVSRAEFSALLALISGAGSRVRSDLIQQLPAEGASLVDKLLDDAATEQTTDESTGDTLTGEGAFPGEKGLRTALQHGSHDRDAQRAAQDVSEALRYGILNTSIDATSAGRTPTESASDDIVDLPTYAKNRGSNGLLGISRAAQRISAQLGGQGELEGDRNALAVLSRIATKGGTSLEQLMAIGDVRGADARAALDALLAKAGTPAGTEIADSAAASTAAAMATASALAGAMAASAADPTTPIKDLDAVAPELRSRVQRVIDRMKGEYGHDVSIVETARSQERQDQLYEQGRTRPGAVVTWTRDSAHTRGDAVDVIVDGSWANAQGFARLQRIAKEEGLHTLGMKDPGHLELDNHGERARERLRSCARQGDGGVSAPVVVGCFSGGGTGRCRAGRECGRCRASGARSRCQGRSGRSGRRRCRVRCAGPYEHERQG